jgi:hypothetical protein
MGTSFTVAYAIVYVFHIEAPAVEEYAMHILVYMLFIDNVALVWQGSLANL